MGSGAGDVVRLTTGAITLHGLSPCKEKRTFSPTCSTTPACRVTGARLPYLRWRRLVEREAAGSADWRV